MIAESRAEFHAAMAGASIRSVDAGGLVNPPCVVLFPADGWLTPRTLGGGYEIAWRFVAVTGKADMVAGVAEIDTLAEATVAALLPLRGWDSAELDRPGPIQFEGLTEYYGVPGRIVHR
jgi:hypothetical protein